MYSYLFYLILWGAAFVFIIPVIIVGVIYIFMSNKTKKTKEFTIKDMLAMIKAAKNETDFKSALTHFKSKYKVFNDEKNTEYWLNCIKDLAHFTYWDTDAIAKFGQELEDANPANAKKVSIAIATVLKTKEQKK